jgi:hypothetical protein
MALLVCSVADLGGPRKDLSDYGAIGVTGAVDKNPAVQNVGIEQRLTDLTRCPVPCCSPKIVGSDREALDLVE